MPVYDFPSFQTCHGTSGTLLPQLPLKPKKEWQTGKSRWACAIID
ncbi:hypothetical protein [Coleofasciculus sp.]